MPHFPLMYQVSIFPAFPLLQYIKVDNLPENKNREPTRTCESEQMTVDCLPDACHRFICFRTAARDASFNQFYGIFAALDLVIWKLQKQATLI